jgi:hypothetical protein
LLADLLPITLVRFNHLDRDFGKSVGANKACEHGLGHIATPDKQDGEGELLGGVHMK